MKKALVIITALFLIVGVMEAQTKTPFKFPKKIQFKLFENNSSRGECTFKYEKSTTLRGETRPLALLKLSNFGGMGFTSSLEMHTYIFKADASVYLNSLGQNKKIHEQFRLKRGIGFDGKEGQVFLYREFKTSSGKIQTELYTQYKVVSFLSTMFVASQRVAEGAHQTNKKFNLIADKSTKIVEMKYAGQNMTPYGGERVTTEWIQVTNPNNLDAEVFQLMIYKDTDGYCFPVQIFYKYKDKNNMTKEISIRAADVVK